MLDTRSEIGLILRLPDVCHYASLLVLYAERLWQAVGVCNGHPQKNVTSFGVLGSDKGLDVRPFLLVHLKRSVTLLPLIVDHDCADRKVAFLQHRNPLFIVLLRGEFVRSSAQRNRLDSLLGPSTENWQMMPEHVFERALGREAVAIKPSRVGAKSVERIEAEVHGKNR